MAPLYLPQTEDFVQLQQLLSQLQTSLEDNENAVELLIRSADKFTVRDVNDSGEDTDSDDDDEPDSDDSSNLAELLEVNQDLRQQVSQQTEKNCQTTLLLKEYKGGLDTCLSDVRELAWTKTSRNIGLHRKLQPGYFDRNQEIDAMEVCNAEIRREIELEVSRLRELVRKDGERL